MSKIQQSFLNWLLFFMVFGSVGRQIDWFSVANRGARTDLKHRAWRSSCRARHNVERDISNELCRRSTLRVCRGFSVTATSISANTSVVRRFRRTSTQMLDLRLDALQRPVWPQCTHLAWFSGPHRATGAAERRLALPSQRHDRWVQKLLTREKSKEEVQNCLSNDHHPSSG